MDRKKVAPLDALFNTVAMDWFTVTNRVDHILSHEANRAKLAQDRGYAPKFIFCLHLQIPHAKTWRETVSYSLVVYFIPRDDALVEDLLYGNGSLALQRGYPAGYQALLQQFMLEEDDDFRSKRFKLIPKVPDIKAVPNKPLLVGTKLKMRSFRGPRYLELCLDIGGHFTPRVVTSQVASIANMIIAELCLVIEGRLER